MSRIKTGIFMLKRLAFVGAGNIILMNSHKPAFAEPAYPKPIEDSFSLVLTNDFKKLENLIENGLDVNATDSDGNSLLHFAVSNKTILKYLLLKGADINLKNKGGYTPLHIAAKRGELDSVITLVNSGADIESLTNTGKTPLHYAATCLGDSIVKFLIDRGAKIDTQDELGMTPFYYAMLNSNEKNAKTLLDFGANYNLVTAESKKAIHYAIENDCKDIAIYLMKIPFATRYLHNGETPLHIACRKLDKDIIEHILKNSPSKVFENDNDGMTALHVVVDLGSERIIDILIKNHANIEARNKAGETPVFFAVKSDEFILDHLINKNANIRAKDAKGNTLLHRCAHNNYSFQAAQKLLKMGENPNIKNEEGKTPLQIAAEKGSTDIILLLLENGVDKTLFAEESESPHELYRKYLEANPDYKSETSLNCLKLLKFTQDKAEDGMAAGGGGADGMAAGGGSADGMAAGGGSADGMAAGGGGCYSSRDALVSEYSADPTGEDSGFCTIC